MAKRRLASGYTFDASAQTLVHADFSDITLEGIQLIVNVTDQIIIYNFADTAKGGTLSTDTLTLEYDTTLMDDTDKLMILVEDGIQTIAVTQSGAWNVGLNAGTNAIGKLAANSGVDIGDVDVTSIAAGDNNIGNVDIVTVPADPFGVNADAASATGSISAKLRFIAGTGIPITGTVTVGSHAVTNAGTFAVQVDGNALTSLQLIDDTVFTDDTSTHTTGTTKGQGIMAVANPTDAAVDANDIGMVAMTLARAMKNDITTIAGTAPTTAGFIDIKGADGNVFVRQTTASNLNMTEASAASILTSVQLIDDMIYTDDTSTHATGTSKGALMMAAATPTDTAVNANDIGAVGMTNNRELYVSIRDIVGAAAQSGSGTATGALRVELANNGTGLVGLNAGTNGIGKLTANSGVTIGAVEIAAAQTLATVTTVTTLTGTTTLTPGTGATNLGKAEDGAHTTGDVGVMALGVRNNTPNTATTNADADYSQVSTDMVGGMRTALYETDFAVLGTNHVKKYYTNAGSVTDGIVWSPAAGKRWYVTDIFIQTSAAATITLEDDLVAGDSAVWKAELAANSGWSHHYGTPLFSGEDAADLMVTTSAGNVYITITGYEI